MNPQRQKNTDNGTFLPSNQQELTKSYIKACMDFGANQVLQGLLRQDPVVGPLVSAFLETLPSKKRKRGEGSSTDEENTHHLKAQRQITAIPEVMDLIKTEFEDLYAKVEKIRADMNAGYEAQSKALRDFRNDLASGFMFTAQRLGGHGATPVAPVVVAAATATATPSAATAETPCRRRRQYNKQPTNTTTSDDKEVIYRMNRNLITVPEIWREYIVGINGGPSLQLLEAEHGKAWRKDDPKEERYFIRRMTLIREIKRLVSQHEFSCEEAAVELEERRMQLHFSLDKLRRYLDSYS